MTPVVLQIGILKFNLSTCSSAITAGHVLHILLLHFIFVFVSLLKIIKGYEIEEELSSSLSVNLQH